MTDLSDYIGRLYGFRFIMSPEIDAQGMPVQKHHDPKTLEPEFIQRILDRLPLPTTFDEWTQQRALRYSINEEGEPTVEDITDEVFAWDPVEFLKKTGD